MVPLRFRHHPINVLESDGNSPGPRKPHFRDWFARDSPLQRRVTQTRSSREISGAAFCPGAISAAKITADTLRRRPPHSISPLEGRVTSEPVSEMGFFGGPGLPSDSKTFMGWCRKRTGTIPARIGRNFGFCPSAGFPGDIFLRYLKRYFFMASAS